MEEAKARRYKPGREFFYDLAFAAESRLSEILNGLTSDLGMLEYLLEKTEKVLDACKNDLSDFQEGWKMRKQLNFNKGQKTVEDDLTREKRLKIEALIDVRQWEISQLKEAIEEAIEDDAQSDLPPFMPRGPVGLTRVSGYTATGHADGQRVEPVNGIPCIVDERSQYLGMSVLDYVEHVAKPWKIACEKHNTQRRKQLLAEGVKEEKLLARYTVPYPEYPDVKNYLANGQATKKMVRTKK